MKTNNKKKVVVSVLALAMGAGLAGSISGSVAWYQYSTRTTAQLQGVSAGTSRNLQVRINTGTTESPMDADAGWKQDLSVADINSYLNITGVDGKLALTPVTTRTAGSTNTRAKNAALATRSYDADGEGGNPAVDVPEFFNRPVYQYGDLPEINKANFNGNTYNYVVLPLQFKLEDNGVLTAKDVFLTAANFLDARPDKDDATPAHENIVPALRVHLSAGTGASDFNALIASGDADGSYAISGALDLNNNGKLDRDDFVGTDADNTKNIIHYGNKTASSTTAPVKTGEGANVLTQAFYSPSSVLANDTNPEKFSGGISLGKTKAKVASGTQDFLSVNVTIWLEGWHELEKHPKANDGTQSPEDNTTIWDTKYIGSDFALQLRFACEADA